MVNKDYSTNSGWNFDNSYIKLSNFFYSNIELNPIISPELIILNNELANKLGLNIDFLKSKPGINILSGTKKLESGSYIAQAYAGHQFGHFTKLGDGRALLIGEQITPLGERFDIQLKGSGITPYSRRGDGKAALGPMLREYIISEAMHGLKIPTTRSLAVIKTNEPVYREFTKKGAILTRVSSSHIRFGTFEYASNFGSIDDVKDIAEYSIKRHYPHLENDPNKYINFLKEVASAHAKLVSMWQSIGFIHGVMNTDNMTISGETIDYGPCAFMDVYDPDTVFSSIDVQGRYSYKNQPLMTQWNLCRFAETLLPLIHSDKDKSISMAQEVISIFSILQHNIWLSLMRNKLGIFNEELQDKALIEDLLDMMLKYKADYTNTFVYLTHGFNRHHQIFDSLEFNNWHNAWQERLQRQPQSKDLVFDLMKNSNPLVIPRNHRVEEVLSSCEKGNFDTINNFLHVLYNPFEYSKEIESYWDVPLNNSSYKTFCGT